LEGNVWVFTIDGFFSVVENQKHSKKVLVRARYHEDLVKFAKAVGLKKVWHTPKYDYPYRVSVPKKTWKEYLARSAMNIDYSNFKEAALKDATDRRARQYLDVWVLMVLSEYEEDEMAGERCDGCGKAIRKSKSKGPVYNIDDDGKLWCESCKDKQRIAELDKTFDEPLHRKK
jgi:hypothetical protein